jgi:YbbR domain-containing protein
VSETNRTWGLRILALGIAVGLWFNFSFQAREAPSERLIEASVSYNRARGILVLNPLSSLNVRVRGSSKSIRQLNPFQVSVQIDLSRANEGTYYVNIDPENVLMPENLQLVSIEPSNTIRVELEREESARLAVAPQIVGEPAAGSTLQETEVLPNQVLVSGPASLLRKFSTLKTEAVDLTGHALTFDQSVAVLAPDPLVQIVQPSRVTMHISLLPMKLEMQPQDGAKHKGKTR